MAFSNVIAYVFNSKIHSNFLHCMFKLAKSKAGLRLCLVGNDIFVVRLKLQFSVVFYGSILRYQNAK